MSNKIILVEDNPADALFAMQTMKRRAGNLELTFFDEGEALFDHLKNDSSELPKLILLDMHMPGLSGMDILRKLKRSAQFNDIPVIMLTSSTYERDITESYAAGATSYIVKPLTDQKLTEVLNNLSDLILTAANR